MEEEEVEEEDEEEKEAAEGTHHGAHTWLASAVDRWSGSGKDSI